MISSVESLSGIYNGYIIFYKEVDEDRFRNERLVSARSFHLITGLKNWTSYLIFIRVETLNGIGRKSDTKLVWTKPIGKFDQIKGPFKRFLQHAFNTVVEPNVGDV